MAQFEWRDFGRILGGEGRRDAVAFAGPRAQINTGTSSTAKRAPAVARDKRARLTARWAAYRARVGGSFTHEHKVSSNAWSSVTGRIRPSVSAHIRRIDTISRWPEISGTKLSALSRRIRSRW